MIRPGRQPRPDSACHSADVLTPTERAADRSPIIQPEITRHKAKDGGKTWADHPELRTILQSLRATL